MLTCLLLFQTQACYLLSGMLNKDVVCIHWGVVLKLSSLQCFSNYHFISRVSKHACYLPSFCFLGKEYRGGNMEWIFPFSDSWHFKGMKFRWSFQLNMLVNWACCIYATDNSIHYSFQIMRGITKEAFPTKLIHDVCVTMRKYLFSSQKPLVRVSPWSNCRDS